MLLHAEEYEFNFGLSCTTEPLQLSSILYALYSLAHELCGNSVSVENTDTEIDDFVTNIRKSPIDCFRQVRHLIISNFPILNKDRRMWCGIISSTPKSKILY